MAGYKRKKTNTFPKTVSVMFPDDSTGDIKAEFKYVTQDQLEDLIDRGDVGLLREVLVSVGEIEIEGSTEKLTGQAAIDEVVTDPCAVSALTADYIEVMKSRNFRDRGSKKRR